MIATILSLNGGLLTTILCLHNQYLVTINSQIKLSVCLCVRLINPSEYFFGIEGHVALVSNPGLGYNTLLLRLAPGYL